MGFNGLVLSGRNHQARFDGGSATDFKSRSEGQLSKPRFADLVQLMNRVLEEGGRTVQGLHAPHDKQLSSLGHALAAVPNDLGLPSSIRFRVLLEGRQRELKESARDEGYHIGREAIFNAFRHSEAKDIETQIEYRATGLRLSVRDNGRGIDPQHLQWGRSGHVGLLGMLERAERIGARFRISSRVALGTEVQLWVPEQLAFAQNTPRAVS